MAEKNVSAEQQLLSLIEGNDKAVAGGGQAAGVDLPGSKTVLEPSPMPLKPQPLTCEEIPITKRSPPVFSVDILRGRLSFAKESLKSLFRAKDFRLDEHLHIVINLLIVVVVLICCFLVAEAVKGAARFKELPELLSAKKTAAAEKQALGTDSTDSLAVYLEKINRRDVFKPKLKESVMADKAVPVSMLDTVAAGLRLAGISPDEKEKYAMIEDTKTQTTFFVREGETVSGLTLKQILENKVILTDGVGTVELK